MTRSLHLPRGLSRRSLLGAGALGAGALGLAACGGPEVGGGGSDGGSGGAEEKDLDFADVEPADQIDFWTNHPGGSQEVEKELLAAFTEEAGIAVNHVTAGSNYEEIAQCFQTSQAANSGLPAVVVLSDVWWFRYFVNGNIIPIDTLVDQLGIDLSDYRDSLVADYQYDDKQWALPYGRFTPLFYYNKDHFSAAGLPGRAPETWSEFEEWAPELTQGDTAYMYPDLAGYAGWTLQNVLWGHGSGWSDEWDITCAEPEAMEAMQWVQDSVFSKGWAKVSSGDSADTFAAGVCSTTIASTGSLVGVLESARFEVGVGFLPGGSESGPVYPTGGAGLGIPSAISKEEQLAGAKLIEFMGRPESTVAFSAATGYMPIRKSADLSELTAKTPQIQTAVDQLEVAKPQDYARAFLPAADQEMAKSIAEIVTTEGDVQTAMEGLKKTLEGIYTKEVEPKLGWPGLVTRPVPRPVQRARGAAVGGVCSGGLRSQTTPSTLNMNFTLAGSVRLFRRCAGDSDPYTVEMIAHAHPVLVDIRSIDGCEQTAVPTPRLHRGVVRPWQMRIHGVERRPEHAEQLVDQRIAQWCVQRCMEGEVLLGEELACLGLHPHPVGDPREFLGAASGMHPDHIGGQSHFKRLPQLEQLCGLTHVAGDRATKPEREEVLQRGQG